jgi:hypothetical protein
MFSSKTDIQIDSHKLVPILASLFNQPVSDLASWKIEPLHGGLEPNHQLFFLSGEAVLAGKGKGSKDTDLKQHPWSLVLKIVHPSPQTESNLQGVKYWKREALAYQTGLLQSLSCGLTAPICYEASQEGEGYWLWLEKAQDDFGKPWTLEQHREVARCLGCSNGAYLAGKPMPDEPWLSSHWLRRYLEDATPNVQNLSGLRKLPLFQRSFPQLSNEFFLEAWGLRGVFLDELERLPQTFCHQDAFIGNLFWRGEPGQKGFLTALDWAYAGVAAIGEELAPLITMSTFNLDAYQLLETCLEGYLAGLAESDWNTDPLQVRFSALTTIFYRYLFGAIIGEAWSALQDESNHAAMAAAFGVPEVGVLCDFVASQNLVYKGFFTEARQLLARLR